MKKLLTFLIRKRCYKTVLVFFFCVYGQIGYAQLSFSIYGEFSGKCSDLDKGLVNAYIKSYQARITSIPTRNACEEMRQRIGGISASMDGCTYRIVCTPCVGHDISTSSSSVNTPLNSNVLGPNQGTTYFYTNQANEIRQWQEDSDRLLGIIGNKGASVGLTHVETGDETFDKTLMEDANIATNNRIVKVLSKGTLSKGRGVYIGEGNYIGVSHDELKTVDKNANQENVNDYISKVETFAYDYFMNPRDLEIALPHLFKTASGFDIEKIMNKLPNKRTDVERQAIADYNEFVKQMGNRIIEVVKDKKADINKDIYDYAILADDSYIDGHGYLVNTDYRKLTKNMLGDEETVVSSFIENLDILNNQLTGFSASLYYNKVKEKYVIAFRGSESPLDLENLTKDWLETNLRQAAGKLTQQYGAANTVANLIQQLPQEIQSKIVIVGHSLGGGMGSAVGAISGLPTHVFNPAGLHDNTLKKYAEINSEKDVDPDILFQSYKRNAENNIEAHISSKDILNILQDKGVAGVLEEYPLESAAVIAGLSSASALIPYVATSGVEFIGEEVATGKLDKVISAATTTKDVTADLFGAWRDTPKALGKRDILEDAGSHSMISIMDHLGEKYTCEQLDWSRANNIQYAVQKQLNSGELFKRESISIKSYQE